MPAIKRLLIILIGFIGFLLLEFNYLNGFIHTPPDSVYLGTVHYPPDYFSYLSFIAQGKDHFLSSTILYTSEKTPLVLVKWQFVLLGKILSIFPFNTGQMYQIAVVILSICLFVSGYLLICLLLEKYGERILAFLFFVSSTSWPIISLFDGKLIYGYHNYWFNTGNFFARFGPTPNHQLGTILLICGFILILRWHQKIKAIVKINVLRYFLAFTFIGVGLASVSPMHWILLLGSVVALFIILALQVQFKEKKLTNYFSQHFPPIFFLFLGGLPVVFYIMTVFKIFPYSITNKWEISHQDAINFSAFLYGSGIVILFAAVGYISYFRNRIFNPERILTLTFTTISIVFFFTDLPRLLGTANIRFWPEGIYVFIAVLGAKGVLNIANWKVKYKNIAIFTLLIFYMSTTLPSLYAGIKERSMIDNRNMYYYLPKNVYSAYEYSSDKIKRPSVFLLPIPYDYSFPAFTGQKSYTGDPLSHMNIDSNMKYTLAKKFFNGVMEEKDAREALIKANISYILVPYKSVVEKYSFLKKIYSSGEAVVYEVRK